MYKKIILLLTIANIILNANAGWNEVDKKTWPFFAWHYVRKPVSLLTRIQTSDHIDAVERQEKSAHERATKKLHNHGYITTREKSTQEKHHASRKRFLIGITSGFVAGGLFTLHHFFGNHESEKISVTKTLGFLAGGLAGFCSIDGFYELCKAKNYVNYLKIKERFYGKSTQEIVNDYPKDN